jgi:hypothetical protein
LGPVTFGLGMLFVFHTFVGIANVTTLENMAGASFGCLPMDMKRVKIDTFFIIGNIIDRLKFECFLMIKIHK